MPTSCPSCQTVQPDNPDVPVTVGGAWQCTRCGQQWDVQRLATAAAYAVYVQRMPIPGARERNTLTVRVPGSGGFASYSTVIPQVGSSMDATTIAAHEREGGGAPNQRLVSNTQ